MERFTLGFRYDSCPKIRSLLLERRHDVEGEYNLTDREIEQFYDTALDTGYDPETELWEVIVKYTGDVMRVERELGIDVEILSENYAIITLLTEEIRDLENFWEIENIERAKTLRYALYGATSRSCISGVQSPREFNLTGQGCVIAILDSGIDYTHPDFRNEDGSSRIAYIWDQTVDGRPPSGFKHGTEYAKVDLDIALKERQPFGVVPEIDFIGHGTAVAGAAAGNGRGNIRNKGVAPEAAIIAVKIGEKNRPAFARTPELMRAIKYVIDKAQDMNMPIAINISFGTNDGSHAGDSLFETYINEMARKWKVSIVVATGNEGSSGHHYSGRISSRETQDVTFLVSEGLTSFYVTMWKNFVDSMTVELITPNNRSTGELRFSEAARVAYIGNIVIYCEYGQPRHYDADQQVYFQIKATSGTLPPGLGTLRIRAEGIVDGRFDIWLPINEMVGKTSFTNPEQAATLTIPSTSLNVISVGGYDHRMNSIAVFSGRGYTRNSIYIKPDLVAPAVDILTTRRGGGYDTYTGTSIAAPLVTGSVALMMQWGIVNGNDPYLFGERVKAFLLSGANREPNIQYPNNAWGYGALCLSRTMNQMVDYLHKGVIPAMSTNILPGGRPIPDAPFANGDPAVIQTASTSDPVPSADPPTDDAQSLREFVALTSTIGFNALYTPSFVNYLKDKPYIKVSTVLENDNAILYTSEENMDGIFADSGYDFMNTYPEIYGLLDKEAMDSAGITQVREQPYLNLTGQGVIIGFVDTGIDYTNPIFHYEDGTSKINSIWDQTVKEGSLPDDIHFGAVYTQENLNQALKNPAPLAVVPHQDTVGHGTFLASIAAGREKGEMTGAAPAAEIIAVKLRKASPYYLRKYDIPPKQDNAYESTDILLGIRYIIQQAYELGRPVVVCLALGSNFGGHDGNNKLEQYISHLSVAPGHVFVTAGGNEGNARHHAQGRIERERDSANIDVAVGHKGSSFATYIWYQGWDTISISVRSPTGEVINRIPFEIGTVYQKKFLLEDSSVTIMYHQNESRFIILQVRDTTPGIWQITLHGDVIISGDFHAWLPITGFSDPDVEFINSSSNYTIVVPATSLGSITCCAYNGRYQSLYALNSWGPTVTPRMAPDLVAPGVNVEGVYPSGIGSMSGTSVSAAVTSGACALLLEWGIVQGNEVSMNCGRVRTLLIRGCDRDDSRKYPSVQWGYGTLNLYRTFTLLREQ